ncbi:hypothetical protein GCM10023094_50040 [Rhodococcus olei]|uniref:DUF2778 domain-containing protein n=1 Tax=Rhodococcus olei TaxID=2161675 RepID=A0ABP8PNS0_9NOCA
MANFAFQESPFRTLTDLALKTGEEARPIVWQGAPGDHVHTAFFRQSAPLVFIDELNSGVTARRSFRTLRVTGRISGSGQLTAAAVTTRHGDDVPTLGVVNIRVDDASDTETDMTYSGRYLYWHGNRPSIVRGSLLFPATSGLVGHQIALAQNQKDHGPLPEGLFALRAAVSPGQASVEAANRRGDNSTSNTEEGVQFLRIGGQGIVDINWGTMRVKLNPLQGDMHKRDGFYIHNSRKGYSHGCIEVAPSGDGVDFFAALLAYSNDPKKKQYLKLRVKYSYPAQDTVGNTFDPQYEKRRQLP